MGFLLMHNMAPCQRFEFYIVLCLLSGWLGSWLAVSCLCTSVLSGLHHRMGLWPFGRGMPECRLLLAFGWPVVSSLVVGPSFLAPVLQYGRGVVRLLSVGGLALPPS